MRHDWTIVLDDDPTGTQRLAGVPVVIDAAPDTFAWARAHGDVAYVLTNTRAQTTGAAAATVRRTASAATAAAVAVGEDNPRFLSRGDSTLRGHFPTEVAVLRDAVPAAYAGCLLVPAFPVAGRVTVDGIHLVRTPQGLVPAGSSEFARDATFGYTDSVLADWARHRVPAEWDVARIASEVVDAGPAAVAARIRAAGRFTVHCPDVRDEEDLRVVAAAQRSLEEEGIRLLVQCGPAYPVALLDLAAPDRLTDPVFAVGPGLVVVGSHTEVTSRQLAALEESGVPAVHVDVARIADGAGAAEARRCAAELRAALAAGTAVLATSRRVRVAADPVGSLRIANLVADIVVEITREALIGCEIAFLLAKGGITSHDALARSLGWRAATVLGPLVASTLGVWRDWEDPGTGPLCVIAPGNVGDADLLTGALERIQELTMRSTQ